MKAHVLVDSAILWTPLSSRYWELQGLSLDLASRRTRDDRREEAEFAMNHPTIVNPPNIVLMGSNLVTKSDKEIVGSFAAYLD